LTVGRHTGSRTADSRHAGAKAADNMDEEDIDVTDNEPKLEPEAMSDDDLFIQTVQDIAWDNTIEDAQEDADGSRDKLWVLNTHTLCWTLDIRARI
jgi:hypothetical protein